MFFDRLFACCSVRYDNKVVRCSLIFISREMSNFLVISVAHSDVSHGLVIKMLFIYLFILHTLSQTFFVTSSIMV